MVEVIILDNNERFSWGGRAVFKKANTNASLTNWIKPQLKKMGLRRCRECFRVYRGDYCNHCGAVA